VAFVIVETRVAIYFDTFGEHYRDMKIFHEHVVNLLNPDGGIYSFFNGLAGVRSCALQLQPNLCIHNLQTNPFFHDVYCRIAQVLVTWSLLKLRKCSHLLACGSDGTRWHGPQR